MPNAYALIAILAYKNPFCNRKIKISVQVYKSKHLLKGRAWRRCICRRAQFICGEQMMLKIAVVENEPEQAELLRGYIARYSEESGVKCNVTAYPDGLDFITDYKPGFDAVFMDIKMPLVDGMEAAEKLREMDKDVILIFVTNMGQLAIKGYKVNAMDFIVKPVSYFDFSLEMEKIRREHDRRSEDYIWVKTAGVLRRVDFADIYYIEIIMHDIYMHTEKDTLNFRGSLKNLEERLDARMFSRCNNCYIVNLQHVNGVKDDLVLLESGDELHMSRTRKKQFMNELAAFFSGTTVK